MEYKNLQILPEDNLIVVIGLTATGKTTLTEKLTELCPDHSVYHTDDYIHFGFKESLYKLISDLRADPNPKKIIEGVQGFRLLRKGVELMDFLPDLVILAHCSKETRHERYYSRPENSGKDFTTFDKVLYRIHCDYMDVIEHSQVLEKRPKFLNIETE